MQLKPCERGLRKNLLQFFPICLLINVQRVVTMLFSLLCRFFHKPEKNQPKEKIVVKNYKNMEKMFSPCRPMCCDTLWWSERPFFNLLGKMKKFWLIRVKKSTLITVCYQAQLRRCSALSWIIAMALFLSTEPCRFEVTMINALFPSTPLRMKLSNW